MRIRKTSILYACFFFLLFFLFLYFTLDTSANARTGLLGNGGDFNSEIKAKIHAIEEDIVRNEDTLKLIRKAIADFARRNKTTTGVDLDLLIQRLDELKRLAKTRLVGDDRLAKIDRPSVRLPPDMCPANGFQSASVDISMMNVYQRLPFDNPDGGVWKQGFPIQYNTHAVQKKRLKIIVVPHSHQDPGWVKTYNDYFLQQTKSSLDNMLVKLTQYKDMSFIYAEMAFFSKWWEGLTSGQRMHVKNILKEGRLEIVTGGWVMNDEANTHYHAMVDQLMEGHQWLVDNLDIRPNASWSIDPFGHSATMAYLLRKSGIKHMLIQRVHYAVKKHFALNQQFEFVWRQLWGREETVHL